MANDNIADNLARKSAEMAKLRAEIISRDVCAELRQQAINLVMGEGSLDADVVFIGEAPGKKEDAAGVPFIGAAGKFLDVMLTEAGMSRDNVYITNIVKYRPPENRDPTPLEKREFWPFLVRQLQIIDPKIIVTLGRHSMENFLPGAKIGDVHGQPHSASLSGDGEADAVILPLYHPAAALYNGGLRATLLSDFRKVPELLSGISDR